MELPSISLILPHSSIPVGALSSYCCCSPAKKPGPIPAWISSVPWPNSQIEENSPLTPGSHPPNQQEHYTTEGMSSGRHSPADVPISKKTQALTRSQWGQKTQPQVSQPPWEAKGEAASSCCDSHDLQTCPWLSIVAPVHSVIWMKAQGSRSKDGIMMFNIYSETKHWVLPTIVSLNLCNNPVRQVLLGSHFTDVKTEKLWLA